MIIHNKSSINGFITNEMFFPSDIHFAPSWTLNQVRVHKRVWGVSRRAGFAAAFIISSERNGARNPSCHQTGFLELLCYGMLCPVAPQGATRRKKNLFQPFTGSSTEPTVSPSIYTKLANQQMLHFECNLIFLKVPALAVEIILSVECLSAL